MAGDEPTETERNTEGRWRRVYLAAIVYLVVVIAALYAFSRWFGG